MRAQDGSGYSQEITLHIKIKNRNDNSPVVEQKSFLGYIEENSAEDSMVLTTDGRPLVISAHDSDVENPGFKYEMINPARYFKIGENTGEIRTTKVLTPFF